MPASTHDRADKLMARVLAALDALARWLDRIITGKAANAVSLKARSGPAGLSQ